MTNKDRFNTALAGGITDRPVVTVPYTMLSNADHWTEITGRSIRDFYLWEASENEDEILSVYRRQWELLPFDFVQPYAVPDAETRAARKIITKNNRDYFLDTRTGVESPLPESIHNANSGESNEYKTCRVFDKSDAKRVINPLPADKVLAKGEYDHARLVAREFGHDNFVVTGGLVNSFYSNVYWMGMQTFLERLATEPELVLYCNEITHEKNLGIIEALASLGGDAIYIDDALAVSEMISLEMYEKFALPTLTRLVKEVHSRGMKAILIYFGGIDDRVEQISSTGADLLFMETPMKTFRNDYADVSRRLGGKMCLATNLNPYSDIEIASDEELRRRIEDMSALGRAYGKYVVSAGSPLTPNTSVERMRQFIEIGRGAGVKP